MLGEQDLLLQPLLSTLLVAQRVLLDIIANKLKREIREPKALEDDHLGCGWALPLSCMTLRYLLKMGIAVSIHIWLL
jgi:hypothetical protein